MKLKIVPLIALFLFPGAVQAAEKVTLQLRWDHQFQFAGYYAAKWRGYYADAGFDVEIRSAITPDGTILKAVEEVSAGRADFGVGAADILIARDRGADLVVLASIFQQSAAAFFALEGTPLDSPKDLLDLRVARNVDGLIDIELQAMLRAEGIDPAEIEPYPHESGIAHVVEGRVDVVPGYRITAPFLFRKQDVSFKMLLPANYGIDFYGDSLFTRRRVIEQNPDAVERFANASEKGWTYALEHPDEIADRIAAELPHTKRMSDGIFRELNRFQIEAVKELTHHPIVEVGHINPHRWRRMNELLQSVGIVETNLDTDKSIFDPSRWKKERERRRNTIIVSTLLILVPAALFGIILAWTIALKKAVTRKTSALMESERQFRAMFENHHSVMLLIDPDTGGIVRANKAAENYYGYSVEDFSNLTIYRLNQGQKENIAEAMAKAKAEKYNCFHFPHRLANGDIRDVEVHSSPIPFKGQTTLFSIVHDITQRKRAEEGLRESETRYRALFQCAQDVILIADDEARYTDANPAASLVLGYSHEELIKMSAWDITPRSIREQVLPLWRKFIGTGCQSGEYKAIRKDGTLLDFEYKAVANILPGRHLSLMRDITDRKRAEQALRDRERAYRFLAANLPEMDVYLFDLDLTFNIAEGSLMKRWGGSPGYFEGKKLEKLLDQERRDLFIPTYQRALRGEHVKIDFSWKDHHFYHQVIPLRSENGEIEGGIALTQDITDRKRTHIALQKALEEKEVLLREIHHRVKNNMQTIIGLLRMHARRVDNVRLMEIFNDCRDRIGAMSLIHEALYQSENLAKIDFNVYLKKLCHNLAQAHDAPRRRIDLTTSAADVSLDMDQGVAVGMIISELISNAFKHAFQDDEGGAVSVHLDHPDGETVRLVVSDTGIGLPADFDIRNPSSLGMRLVVGAVTRELGGSVEATSDGGAKFVIHFPCETA